MENMDVEAVNAGIAELMVGDPEPPGAGDAERQKLLEPEHWKKVSRLLCLGCGW